MAYCQKCKSELDEDALFCQECGERVHKKRKERTIVYEGDIHKCPNCGENLKSFIGNCPQCGHEIRNTESTDSIKEFEGKLERIEEKVMSKFQEKNSVMKNVFGRDFKSSDEYDQAKYDFEEQKEQQKVNLIINYSVPNTKEDILEFMILVASNINTKKDIDDDVTKAWISKLDQLYQRAELVIGSGPDFDQIKRIYAKKKQDIYQKKKRKVLIIIAVIVGYFLVFLILGLIEE